MSESRPFQQLHDLDQKLTAAFVDLTLPEERYLNTEWVEAQSPEIIQLVIDLTAYLCIEMIDDKGQHSNRFYQARRVGYKLRTGESDSFGPLTSVYTSIDSKWCLVYG